MTAGLLASVSGGISGSRPGIEALPAVQNLTVCTLSCVHSQLCALSAVCTLSCVHSQLDRASYENGNCGLDNSSQPL